MTTGIYAFYEKSAHKRKITSDTYKPLYEHKLYKIFQEPHASLLPHISVGFPQN